MRNPIKDASGKKEEALNRLRKLKDFRPSQDEIDVTIVDRDLERGIDEIESELYPSRVLRGNYWDNYPFEVVIPHRSRADPKYTYSGLGFRIVRTKK